MKYYKLSPDFPEHGGRVVYLSYFDNDPYFCLGSGYLPSDTDKKYLIPIDLQTLERGVPRPRVCVKAVVLKESLYKKPFDESKGFLFLLLVS